MRIGIIGAGTMGSGIAQAFAVCNGYEVVLCDIKEENAQRARSRIQAAMELLVNKGKIEAHDCESALKRITIGTIESVNGCDLIVEAAMEDMAMKKQIFSRLQEVCNPETIFTTNTSSLSVTELSAGLDRPVIGMHFFNPAPAMKLVEVITGMITDEELVEKVIEITKSIGKVPVRVKEGAGFVVNRLLVPMINEGIGIYAEGLASKEDIDNAMKLGANHPMGPLELSDLIGLDVCLAIMEVLHEEFGEAKYRPHPLLRKMVRAGLLGRKSNKGFYTYNK